MQHSDLSIDTKRALMRYYEGIFQLCSMLLPSPDYHYILLGRFQTEDLEKFFSKLRQKVGGGYFISHMKAAHTTRIHLAKKAIRAIKSQDLKLIILSDLSAHSCLNCDQTFTSDEIDTFKYSFTLIITGDFPINICKIIVYIGGYLIKKEGFMIDDNDCSYEWRPYVIKLTEVV